MPSLRSLLRFARRAPQNVGGHAAQRKGVQAHRAILQDRAAALDLDGLAPNELTTLVRLLARNSLPTEEVFAYGAQHCEVDETFYAASIEAAESAPRAIEILEEMAWSEVARSRECYVAAIRSCADEPHAPLWREGVELLQRMRLEGGTHAPLHSRLRGQRAYSSAHLDAPCGEASAAAMRGCMRAGAWQPGLSVLARLYEEGVAPSNDEGVVDALLLGCAQGMPASVAASVLGLTTCSAAASAPSTARGAAAVSSAAPLLARIESAASILAAPRLRGPSRRQFHRHVASQGASFVASTELLRCMSLVGVAPSAASFGAAVRAAEWASPKDVRDLVEELDAGENPLVWRSIVTAALERARWDVAAWAWDAAGRNRIVMNDDARRAFVMSCARAATCAAPGEAEVDAHAQTLAWSLRLRDTPCDAVVAALKDAHDALAAERRRDT